MRLKQAPPAWNGLNSNGNSLVLQSQPPITAGHNRWGGVGDRSRNVTQSLTNGTDNFGNNYYVADDNNTTAAYNDYSESPHQITLDNLINSFGDEQVCNQQYRRSIAKGVSFINKTYKNNATLEANNVLQSGDSGITFSDNPITPKDEEERMLEQSDTDEGSDSAQAQVQRAGAARVPRGIVNPNYPGFQHLAHTLQDYSKNIENFYHSENEMTDDDLDAEVIDLSYDARDEEIFCNEPMSMDSNVCNNNYEFEQNNINLLKENYPIDGTTTNCIRKTIYNASPMDEMPDLLKNVTISTTIENNNINLVEEVKESVCSDADIENNFSATPIIGDFNKEIEDEINNIFKYNLSFQDDLQELRKDIEIAFKKPIEDTINHISEVVNHVIKQLVIEQEEAQDYKLKCPYNNYENCLEDTKEKLQVSRENVTNTKKEMKQNRPTFLFLENNINSKTLDAFLSDGKDELQICDEEYEKVSANSIASDSSKAETVAPISSEECHSVLVKENKVVTSYAQGSTYNEKQFSIDGNSNEISDSYLFSDTAKRLDSSSKVLTKEELSKAAKEKDIDTSDLQYAAKLNYRLRKERRSIGASTSGARLREKAQGKSVQNKEKHDDKLIGSFDVYNIETAMPKLDLDTIESHLKAAKEAERRKRNDREEIRRRLAMGAEAEEFASGTERPGRKPSLHSRLQNGMNLQICFMNETVSDNESQNSDSERSPSISSGSMARGAPTAPTAPSAPPAYSYMFNHPYQTRPLSTSILRNEKPSSGVKVRPSSLSLKPSKSRSSQSLGHVPLKEADFHALQATLQTEARVALAQAKEMARVHMESLGHVPLKEADFHALQATLQTEARVALAQAKEMARVHMERERRCRATSPVTEMLRKSLEKANAPLAADRRRVSRHLLTDMNVAQLQVIVNSLHGEVELLSEALVRLLMARDELHMGQDSMLVDIEDLTRYLGVKEQGNRGKAAASKSGVRRLAALVHK